MKMEFITESIEEGFLDVNFSDNLESFIESLVVMGDLLEYKCSYYCVKKSDRVSDVWLDFKTPSKNIMYCVWVEMVDQKIVETGISIGRMDRHSDWNYEGHHLKKNANEEDVLESLKKLSELL